MARGADFDNKDKEEEDNNVVELVRDIKDAITNEGEIIEKKLIR